MEAASSSSNETKETNPEVSLPGSDVNSIEQPAILQVLSPLNASEENVGTPRKNPANRLILLKQPAPLKFQLHNDIKGNDSLSDKNLVSSPHTVIKTPTPTNSPSPIKDCKIDPLTGKIIFSDTYIGPHPDNVLDIESHLIETYNELFPTEESVGIKELPPLEDELQVGCSKIETNDNVRSIIEVEPAKVIAKKPVEKIIQIHEPQQAAQDTSPTEEANGEYCLNGEEIAKVAEDLIDTIEEEIANNWDKISSQVYSTQATEEPHIQAGHSNDCNSALVFEDTKTIPAEYKEPTEAPTVNKSIADLKSPQNSAAPLVTISVETKTPVSKSQNEKAAEVRESTAEEKLSQVVNQHLSEVNSILDSQIKLKEGSKNSAERDSETLNLPVDKQPNLKFVSVPLSKTASEEEERKLFIESLPPLEAGETGLCDTEQLALDCKREYYQSLKKYLVQNNTDKPPLPLQTYRWEDLRRAKERGGYPWTHLYKRPLGPDEQPEIVLMLRKSQEIRFTSESPKSNKKVRIDDHVSIQETERYIQELSEEEDEPNSEHLPFRQGNDLENHSLHSESLSFSSDSVLATGKQPKKSGRFSKVRRLFRRRRYGARRHDDAQSLPDSFSKSSLQHSLEQVPQGSHSQLEQQHPQTELQGELKNKEEPIYVHSKIARCFPSMKKLKSMADRHKKRLSIKRIHLGKDDKIVLNEEPKILKLKNSPKSQRSEIPHFIEKQDSDDVLEIVELDESPSRRRRDDDRFENEENMQSSIVKPEEIIEIKDIPAVQETSGEVTYKKTEAENADAAAMPPKKAPRLRREHVYEEIDHPDEAVAAAEELKFILDATSVDAIKQSLATQDTSAINEVTTTNSNIPLDRMGSSEEEPLTLTDRATPERKSNSLLAPLSSIDSASSDEDRSKVHLHPVVEEETDLEVEDKSTLQANLAVHPESDLQKEYKPSLKKEASPAPSEKKVTFSHVEDEAEPHREDIELTAEQLEATKQATKWKSTLNEHEYEPIGTPSTEEKFSDHKEVSPNESQTTTIEVDTMKQAEDMQKELEARFFPSVQTAREKTPQMEIEVEETEMETEEVAVDAEQTAKTEKKGFMASAQDRTRRMQAGFKNQAGKLRTKLKPAPKKIPSGSPKAKERKKFKAPEFSKIKMPEMRRPDMSKFKDFKRPEFTKFSKPDMSKFKLPEKMTNIKLRRTKSLKESEATNVDVEPGLEDEGTTQKEKEIPAGQKKLFDFNFGTYPRALRKKKSVEVESSFGTGTATEATSIVPSSETQPSLESSSTPQGDRGPGPVRSRWADKFSDVSYNDSEGSRYRRYGSEQESFDRESSLERRMRDDLEDAVSEETHLGILGVVTDNKQFAEFDEENRAIHEISNLRSGEFRRRPIVHQDSDVRSEDSKDAVGWTEKEIQKNILLRKAEREAEASYHKFHSDDIATQETQSTASSGKKVVLEEIGDDEFFLRKRGISQDNIEINQYIRNELRDGHEKPINALQHVGQHVAYGDYDVPPPKPRRLHRAFAPDNISQDFDAQRSDYGDDLSMSHNGSEFFGAPIRPLRKGRSRSKYSMESQDVDNRKYIDEDYLRDPLGMEDSATWNDLNMSEKENISQRHELQQPLPPRRQKRRHDSSVDKDSYVNGFSGRSVSNSFLPPTENIIVYRTEYEYHHVPLATPDKYSDSASTRKSLSNYDLEERQSRGAISFEQNEDIQESEKYVIDMMENDGYAVVRKESVPKPTPPARRKKFLRSPGERFATMPNMRTKRSTPPPERPPPPRGYTPTSDVLTVTGRKSDLSLNAQPNYEDDYEEPGVMERNLQSGDVINKMKYRPLPPPPRPPREKRQRSISKGSEALPEYHSYDGGDAVDVVDGNLGKREISPMPVEEVEACTQTDPLPDDFVCEEFEITEDMKIIEPRVRSSKTVQEMLKEELEKELNVSHQVIDSEQLAKGLQRFRDANQRSLSEKSRASSQADRSKSLSRPQTPSAILIERQSSTPIQKDNTEVVEASLVVRPIDDLELEEEELRREGLLTDSSQHSVSDTKEDYHNLAVSEASYAPSSAELDEALGILTSDPETQQTDEEVEKTLQRYRDELDAIGRELMEAQTTSQEPSPSVSREEIKLSDREIEPSDREIEPSDRELEPSDREEEPRSDLEEIMSDVEYKDESTLNEIQEEPEELTISEVEIPATEPPQPPPRRKSTTLEQSPPLPSLEEPIEVVKQTTIKSENPVEISEQPQSTEQPVSSLISSPKAADLGLSQKELAPMQTIARSELPTEYQLPARVGDLEVERLRVHALQAGQIMVSQLHGQQISSDELECKSGNLVVQNIELPPGLIDDIVKQVRQRELSQHLTTETQTSLQGSSEHLSSSPVREIVPPPKPPRLRDQQQQPPASVPSTDEQTQTEQTVPEIPSTATPLPPTVFPTAEYLQSLAPLAFYNLHRAATGTTEDINLEVRPPLRHRRHHRRSSSSEAEDRKLSETEHDAHHRRRTRSARSASSEDNESVTKAGRKFITACSLFLCKIISQLTDYIHSKETKDGVEVASADIRSKQVPALVVLFLVITFAVLLYLMSGRSVHTHHWDYFNPPGQEGR